MKPITIVTVDDHHLIRDGIRKILEEEQSLQLVGEGWAGEHVEQLLKEYQPDVLLLDISMPQWSVEPQEKGDNTFRVLPTIARLRTIFPTVRIIIFSQYSAQLLITSAIEMGVRGYLLKGDVFSGQLADAIRAVMLGEIYYSEGVTQQLINEANNSSGTIRLTLRQREVLQVVAADPQLSYSQFAKQLGVSVHTFNHHLREIFRRLHVNNLTAAMIRSVRLGLIKIEKPLDAVD